MLRNMAKPAFWISILLGSLTLYSLIVNAAQIDLNGIPKLIWQTYSQFRNWLMSPLIALLQFTPPPLLVDAAITYFFLGTTNLKTLSLCKDTFDPGQKTNNGSSLGTILLWPRTLVAHIKNFRVGNPLKEKVLDDNDGTDELAIGINVMMTHSKLYPLLLLIEGVIAVITILWGSIR